MIFKGYKKTKKTFFTIFFFLYIKITNKYYQKHKEKLQKDVCEIYQKISEEKTKGKKSPRKTLKFY